MTGGGRGARAEAQPTLRFQPNLLSAAAGPLPQYPFYYVRAPGDEYLLVSSRLETLANLFPDAPLDAERLVSLIEWTVHLDSSATVFRPFRRLRPCESISAGERGIWLERKVPRIATSYRRAASKDAAAELRFRLDAAVGRGIGDSKHVAVYTSGGLDSSGVLALATARCRGATPRELSALSVHYAAPGDDRGYLSELTDALGVVPLRLPAVAAGKWFSRSLCADGQPVVLSSTCFDLLLCSKASELGADAILTGVSGDRICGGLLPFAQLARRGHPLQAIALALRVRLPWSLSAWGRLRQLILSPLVPVPLVRLRRRRAGRAAWMTSLFWRLLARVREAARYSAGPLPDSPNEWMTELCERDMLPDVADLGGQVAALTGCAPFDVFLDYEFVRFMLELDPVLLSHGHQFRGLYRLAMGETLPRRLLDRQDKARFEPGIAAAALAAGAWEMLRDLSHLDALASLGLVDPSALRRPFNAWLAALRRGEREEIDPADERWQRMWQLVSVEAFVRERGQGRDLAI
ncbi:MAG: asparagine synthase-related protein [Myxococcota bacterium]|nr:asparagine synthase-related protein [Myxococcota bacterium]